MSKAAPVMLLVEPATLLRRTVSLTARTLGVAHVHEAASYLLATRLLKEQAFDGALIAIDGAPGGENEHALALLDEVRGGNTASKAGMPIAVMVGQCDATLLGALQARGVSRILIKPFRARNLIDAFADLGKAGTAAPGMPLYKVELD